jgi:chromosome condensin MukBEF complex kleisin-like MukF subunit
MNRFSLGLMLGLTAGIMVAVGTLIYTGSRLTEAQAEAYDLGYEAAELTGEQTRRGIGAHLNEGLQAELTHLHGLLDETVEALREIQATESLEAAHERARAMLQAMEAESDD